MKIKISLITLGVLFSLSLHSTGLKASEEDSNFTEDYRNEIRQKEVSDNLAIHKEKEESLAWKRHQYILKRIDELDRN